MRSHQPGSSRGPLLARQIVRYAIGSAMPLLVSFVSFLLMYWLDVRTTLCSVGAFAAGAMSNRVNRRWAWGVQGDARAGHQILMAYLAIAVISLVGSSIATGWAQMWVRRNVAPGDGVRMIVVAGAYVIVQGVMFIAKVIISERSKTSPALTHS